MIQAEWLLLVHQIPPDPPYLRAKVGKRLARVGAIPVKNSVYVMPADDAALEHFQWLRAEVTEGGGEATILRATFVAGLTDGDVVGMFRAARNVDYAAIAEEARALGRRRPGPSQRQPWEADLRRLEARAEEIAAIDFFSAPAAEGVARLLAELRRRVDPPEPRSGEMLDPEELEGRVWVTRAGIKVDRIATAWLIRRFVDAGARFKFVPGQAYVAEPGELRFDMARGEFTHEGDLCTFEVLLARLGLDAPGLRPLAEIVHDIDLSDDRYGRAETPGVAAMISGLITSCPGDEERLERGLAMFDALHAQLAHGRGRP